MAGFPNFVLIKTPGLGQQNTSCDFFEAGCSNHQLVGIKNWNFVISSLILLAPANTNKNIYFFETIMKIHTIISSN